MRPTSDARRARRAPLMNQSLRDLHELEQAAYAPLFRLAGHRSVAVRALSAHVNASLDELRRLADERRVSLRRRWLEGARELLARAASDGLVAGGYGAKDVERSRGAVERGLALAALLETIAADEGDEELAAWCDRFLRARRRFIVDAVADLSYEVEPAAPYAGGGRAAARTRARARAA